MMAARKILKKQIFCYRWFVKSGTLAWASATVTSTTSGSSPRRAASPARLRARWRGSDQVAHRWGDISPRGLHRTQPLGMDVGAPGRAEQARLGQLDLSNSRGRVRSYDDIAPREINTQSKSFSGDGQMEPHERPPGRSRPHIPGGRARRRPGRPACTAGRSEKPSSQDDDQFLAEASAEVVRHSETSGLFIALRDHHHHALRTDGHHHLHRKCAIGNRAGIKTLTLRIKLQPAGQLGAIRQAGLDAGVRRRLLRRHPDRLGQLKAEAGPGRGHTFGQRDRHHRIGARGLPASQIDHHARTVSATAST